MESHRELARQSSTGAQSSHRLLDVLTLVALTPSGLGASEVAERTGLSAPTAHRMLRVLVERGFAVQPTASGPYLVGPQLRLLAGDGVDQAALTRRALPHLEQLRAATDETVLMSVRQGLKVTYVQVLTSFHSLQMTGAPGVQVPLHATSQGQVIMAFTPEDLTERLIQQIDFVRYTESTVADATQLRERLAQIRTRGFAVNLQDREVGVHSVAAPVLDSRGHAVAAVCVAGPIFRLSEQDVCGDVAVKVMNTARELSAGISRAGDA